MPNNFCLGNGLSWDSSFADKPATSRPVSKASEQIATALIAMLTVMVEGIDYGFARGKKAAEIVCFCCDRHPFWMSLLESDPQGER